MAIQIQSSDLSINTLQLSECSWDLTLPPEQTENKLLYGGVVTWLQDYDFHVSAAGYYINNVFYESPEAYITLSPADPLLNRFDVIYVDADQIVKVREGDPSTTPSQPGLDLGLELGLGVVFVEAASTEPVELVQECIYQENGEWTSLVSAGTIDPASSNTPCIGTLSVEATSAASGDYLLMNRSLSFAPTATFNVITFRLKPKSDWSTNPAQHKLILRFRLAGVQVGSTVEISHGNPLGFDVTDTATCQIISISTIQFGIPESAIVDQLQIEVFSTSGTFGWFIDGLCLQGGIFGADEGDFIWNQYFGAQTPGRYWIQGNGRADGWFTSPQRIGDTDNFYMGSEKFGWASSIVGSTTGTAIGYLAKAEGQEGATAVGNQAYANVGVAIGFYSQSVRGVAVGGNQLGPGGVAVGWGAVNTSLAGISLGGGANTSGLGAIAAGYYASATGYGSIAIGSDSQALNNYSVAIGISTETTGERQVVFGGNDTFTDLGYTSLYFGGGVTSPFTADRFWTITGAQGTDIPGNTWRIGGAAGTGSALSGPIEWQTSDPTVSGSTLQTYSTKMALNSNTKGLYLDNTRFQMDEGSDVIASNNLTLGTGNAFTITGSTTINAITNTNWQDGAVVYLLFTGSPTIKNETAGGAGTSQIKLAGDVDFATTPDTLLSLQYKDNFWREVGRTQSSAIGVYTFLNGIHEELGGLVKLGGTLIENTTILGSNFYTRIDGGRFQIDEGANLIAANDLTLGSDGNAFTVTGNTQINAIATANWQEGSVITLHLTGTPTLKHNTAGGVGTVPLRLAGAVDFTITGYTVLELQYKDSFWNEVGRTQAATPGGGTLTDANNGVSLNGTIVTLGQDVAEVGNPGILLSHREIPSGNFTISFNADAAQTVNILQTKNQSAAIRARINEDASFSNTGGQSQSEIFGDNASTTGANSAVFGYGASTTANNTVAIGLNASANVVGGIAVGSTAVAAGGVGIGNGVSNTGNSSVAIGSGAQTTADGGTAVGAGAISSTSAVSYGNNATASGQNTTALGYGAVSTFLNSIALGHGALATAAKQLVVGENFGGVTDVYIGSGVTPTAPESFTLNASGASGSDLAGGSMTLAGGKSTGNATPGVVNIATSIIGASGSTLQTLANRAIISDKSFNINATRFEEYKGANVASANDLTLGIDGNLFTITGAVTINAITTANWQAGSKIGFVFTGAPTVKHNTAGGVGTATMLLAGSTDFVAAAGDYLELRYDGTNWHEVGRKLATSGSGPTVTADNGLRKNTSSNVQWGGPLGNAATLLFDTYIDNDGFDVQFFDGTVSCLGTGTTSERFGAGANATGLNGIALGNTATASTGTTIGTNANGGVNILITSQGNPIDISAFSASVCIGGNITGNGGTAVGGSSTAGAAGVAVGTSATASSSGATALGGNTVASGANSLAINGVSAFTEAIGIQGTTTAANQIVVGRDTAPIVDGYFGDGVTSATPNSFVLNASGGLGTNIAGANFTIAGGKGTGTGAGGNIYLSTANVLGSGTTLQSLTEKAVMYYTGVFGIGKLSSFNATRLEVVDNSVAGTPIAEISSTSTAAASNAQKGLNVSLSGTNANSGQTTYGIYSSNAHAGTSSFNYGIYGTSSNGASVNVGVAGFATGTSAIGVYGNGSGWGGQFISSAVALDAQNSSGGFACTFSTNAASTTGDLPVVVVARTTTGTATNDIAGSVVFQLETTNGTAEESNRLISTWTNVTHASRESKFIIAGVEATVSQNLLEISGAGIFTLTQGLQDFADDAAAAVGGIPVNGLYRTASVVKIRVS